MNERIAELYRQAHEGTKDADGNTPQYFSAEKFAELIIRDVAETAATFRQSKTRPVGWNFITTVLNQYGLKEVE
jgi:hypothetical protein